MLITSLSVKRQFNPNSKLVGTAYVVLDDEFEIKSVLIVSDGSKRCIVMPSRKISRSKENLEVGADNRQYTSTSVCRPLTRELHHYIERVILAAFDSIPAEKTEPVVVQYPSGAPRFISEMPGLRVNQRTKGSSEKADETAVVTATTETEVKGAAVDAAGDTAVDTTTQEKAGEECECEQSWQM